MRTVTCPGCGRSGKIPDDYAGTRAKCPKCSTTMDVPDLPEVEPETFDLGIEIGEPDDAPIVPPLPPRSAINPPSPSIALPRAALESEIRLPWYYGFLGGMAQLFMLIGIAVGSIGVVIGIAGANASGGASILIALYFAALAVFSMVGPAFVYLALDIGRSLRDLRNRPGT
jgi:hypothetical protein